MKKIRNVLLGLFVAVNVGLGAGIASASEAAGKQDLNVDRLGDLIVVWCDGCWFWNCNC